jgi:gluconate 2-dehydrogenase gamma chain
VSWYKNLSRRQFLQLASAAAAAAGTSCNGPFLDSPWRFFTTPEARTLAALCDQFIPIDANQPGADWARVVNYIDIQLCGPFRRWQDAYRYGLAFLDRSSQAKFGQPFALLTDEQQIHLMGAMELNDPSLTGWHGISPAAFFDLLLNHAMQGYYGDPRHGGNRDHTSWKMVGLSYPQIRGRQHYEPQNS